MSFNPVLNHYGGTYTCISKITLSRNIAFLMYCALYSSLWDLQWTYMTHLCKLLNFCQVCVPHSIFFGFKLQKKLQDFSLRRRSSSLNSAYLLWETCPLVPPSSFRKKKRMLVPEIWTNERPFHYFYCRECAKQYSAVCWPNTRKMITQKNENSKRFSCERHQQTMQAWVVLWVCRWLFICFRQPQKQSMWHLLRNLLLMLSSVKVFEIHFGI